MLHRATWRPSHHRTDACPRLAEFDSSDGAARFDVEAKQGATPRSGGGSIQPALRRRVVEMVPVAGGQITTTRASAQV